MANRIPAYSHIGMSVCMTYACIHCFMMAYPIGKATSADRTNIHPNSRMKRLMMSFISAPCILRRAISFRRRSHERLTNEKMPNNEMSIDTLEATTSSFSRAFSDTRLCSIQMAGVVTEKKKCGHFSLKYNNSFFSTSLKEPS